MCWLLYEYKIKAELELIVVLGTPATWIVSHPGVMVSKELPKWDCKPVNSGNFKYNGLRIPFCSAVCMEASVVSLRDRSG